MGVTAEDEALDALRNSKTLDLLRWAAPVAFAATDQLYDEDAGHDQMVIGVLNFTHLRDLLDRATANGRFKIGEGLDGLGADAMKRGISPDAFKAMPRVEDGAIVRRDYKRSPGWAAEGYRVLLQSYPFGKVEQINWGQRSDAKRKVASQQYVGAEALFTDEDFDLESVQGIPDDDEFEGITLIAAHAFNPISKQFELYVGQSKNPEHKDDSCWHWKKRILSGGTPIGGGGLDVPPVLPGDAASTEVDDVNVRIKGRRQGEGSGAANG